jgi:hypothetical protein
MVVLGYIEGLHGGIRLYMFIDFMVVLGYLEGLHGCIRL